MREAVSKARRWAQGGVWRCEEAVCVSAGVSEGEEIQRNWRPSLWCQAEELAHADCAAGIPDGIGGCG